MSLPKIMKFAAAKGVGEITVAVVLDKALSEPLKEKIKEGALNQVGRDESGILCRPKSATPSDYFTKTSQHVCWDEPPGPVMDCLD
jgi:hypothetical protein